MLKFTTKQWKGLLWNTYLNRDKHTHIVLQFHKTTQKICSLLPCIRTENTTEGKKSWSSWRMPLSIKKFQRKFSLKVGRWCLSPSPQDNHRALCSDSRPTPDQTPRCPWNDTAATSRGDVVTDLRTAQLTPWRAIPLRGRKRQRRRSPSLQCHTQWPHRV